MIKEDKKASDEDAEPQEVKSSGGMTSIEVDE